jgi:hypothetical protein
MISFIAYALLPMILFSFVMSAYMIGKWCNDNDAPLTCIFFSVLISAVAIGCAVSAGTNGDKNPANPMAMLGIDVGCISFLFMVLITDYLKRRIKISELVDEKVREYCKKRQYENERFLKKEGI